MLIRWVAAGAAAVGIGMFAVPMMLGSDPPSYSQTAPSLAASHTPACKSDRRLNFDLTLKDMHGTNVPLRDLQGKAILLNYWATWCGPCKIEIPIFNELYEKYKDRGLVIVGVSADDEAATIREFVKKMPMHYPVLLAEDRPEVLEAAGSIYGYPTSFFIDRSGAVCGSHVGVMSKEEFEKSILPLL